jgi:NAD(P)H-hydrate epimerase
VKVANSSEIRLLDREAVEKYGIPEEVLMENAGAAVARLVALVAPNAGGIAVVAGPGKNGGDGLVAARHLASLGAGVQVFLVADPEKITGLVRENYERVTRAGIPLEVVSEGNVGDLREALPSFDVVIDALFGTGLSRPLEGVYREAVEAINHSESVVVSVDIPSGINSDTGEVMGVAVKADFTVTFGLPKVGLLVYPGAEHAGEIFVSHISYPRSLIEDERIKVETNDPLPPPERRPDTHKGDYGKALFIAGSRKYYGAPLLASLSFLKAGGGYSRLATVSSIVPFLAVRAPEVVYEGLAETPSGTISCDNMDKILELARNSDIVAIGPGIGLDEETIKLVLELVPRINKPLIIDGDGLTALSRNTSILTLRTSPTVVTPHVGEMSRLTGKPIEEIKRSRLKTALETAQKLNAYVVLKGAHTIIATPQGSAYINLTGNPGMATAGSGDVLVGAIAAMHGVGFSFEEAVRMGVFIHGLAGDLAAESLGMDGVTAVTIMNFLPKAVKELRENFEKIFEEKSLPILV